MYMSQYETISITLQIIGLISLVLVVIQIMLERKHQKGLHEEQRRIQTIDVISNWNNALKHETRLSEKIVEQLDKKQCKSLYDYVPFYVDESIHKMICQMCSERSESCKDCETGKQCVACTKNKKGEYLVSGIQLTELRGYVTTYLNNLEIVALSWQQAIVDEETILKQFSYLYTPGTKSALETYRSIAGNGNSYPALAAFYQKIAQSNTVTVQRKEEQ